MRGSEEEGRERRWGIEEEEGRERRWGSEEEEGRERIAFIDHPQSYTHVMYISSFSVLTMVFSSFQDQD